MKVSLQYWIILKPVYSIGSFYIILKPVYSLKFILRVIFFSSSVQVCIHTVQGCFQIKSSKTYVFHFDHCTYVILINIT